MGRDLTPRELYATEQWNIQNGRHDLWGLMENVVMTYNGVSQKLHSDEEVALRKGFPYLGKLMNKFPDLHARLSEIEGGIDLLHRKDEELGVYIETGKGDENSALLKWFNGELDPSFHYSDYNESLLYSNLLSEAVLLSGKVWVTVYKDTLGYQDDLDNLTDILVPADWLLAQLKSEGIEDFNEWFSEYTADETEDIARKALEEGVILDFQDECLKSYCNAKVRALDEGDREQVEALDSVSGNDVSWGLDAEGYAWGVFLGDELVGYCTIGGADDPDMGYDDFSQWTNDSLCLSDVFIKKERRGEGLASRLVEEALEKSNPNSRDSVFITLLDDDLINFYEALGFKSIADGVMVREKGRAPSLESQINSAAQSNEGVVKDQPSKDDVER